MDKQAREQILKFIERYKELQKNKNNMTKKEYKQIDKQLSEEIEKYRKEIKL